jgi:DNA-binding transcriptional ArsR family regulator
MQIDYWKPEQMPNDSEQKAGDADALEPAGLDLESPHASPELAAMFQKARKASEFLKALAHENRLMILCLLAESERSVTELEELLALNQATVSQQLARLRHEGIVDTRRDGRTIYYSIADASTKQFMQAIYDKFCRP